MGQHAFRPPTRTYRALLRAGLMAAVAGSALGAAGTAGASAAGQPAKGDAHDVDLAQIPAALDGAAQGLDAIRRTVPAAVSELQLDPLAKTGSDPLDNSVGTQVGKHGSPLSTAALTGPLARGASLSELPTVGPLVSGLTG